MLLCVVTNTRACCDPNLQILVLWSQHQGHVYVTSGHGTCVSFYLLQCADIRFHRREPLERVLHRTRLILAIISFCGCVSVHVQRSNRNNSLLRTPRTSPEGAVPLCISWLISLKGLFLERQQFPQKVRSPDCFQSKVGIKV